MQEPLNTEQIDRYSNNANAITPKLLLYRQHSTKMSKTHLTFINVHQPTEINAAIRKVHVNKSSKSGTTFYLGIYLLDYFRFQPKQQFPFEPGSDMTIVIGACVVCRRGNAHVV